MDISNLKEIITLLNKSITNYLDSIINDIIDTSLIEEKSLIGQK